MRRLSVVACTVLLVAIWLGMEYGSRQEDGENPTGTFLAPGRIRHESSSLLSVLPLRRSRGVRQELKSEARASDPIAAQSSPGLFRGRVLEPSGEPAIDALVVLCSRDEASSSSVSIMTNLLGEFSIGANPEGHLFLSAHKARFVAARLDLGVFGVDTASEVGDMVLGVGGSIGGWIVCKNGITIPGLEVYASNISDEDEQSDLPRKYRNSSTTNPSGYFQMDGLSGAKATLSLAGGGGDGGLGSFPIGELGIVVEYPGRVLQLQLETQAGAPLGKVAIEAVLGFMEDGLVRADSVNSRLVSTRDGRVVIPIKLWDGAILRIPRDGGHFFERTLSLPSEQCALSQRLVVPSNLPLGMVECEMNGPFGVMGTAFRLELTELRDRFTRYVLPGHGPHEVVANRYAGRVWFENSRSSSYLPTEIGVIDVIQGELTHVEHAISIGGRLSILLHAQGATENAAPKAWIHASNEHDWESSLRFYEGSTSKVCDYLTVGSPRLATQVVPAGKTTVSVRAEGFEPTTKSTVILPGEVVQLEIELFPKGN